jgi:hypothetical protein
MERDRPTPLLLILYMTYIPGLANRCYEVSDIITLPNVHDSSRAAVPDFFLIMPKHQSLFLFVMLYGVLRVM